MGIAIGDLAKAISVDEHNLNDLVSTQRGCTGDMAIRLARALNTKPQFWMGLQAGYDLYQAGLSMGNDINTKIAVLV
jgi:addiction module HigA family antidote